MLLQLVVIHYDEDEHYIKSLLDVLALQQWVDFKDLEVLIENDDNKKVYSEDLFKNYPFSIQYHINEWSGRSGVRQHGLDRVTADYVMFCDCDDMFLHFHALYDIFTKLKSDKPDVLFTKFVSDGMENGNPTALYPYYGENVWIHGKVFRTQFLRDNDIKWNTKLNLFEDSYFVRIIDTYNPKKVGIPTPTYLWKYRQSSCTRNSDKEVSLDAVNKFFSEYELVQELVNRNKLYQATVYTYVFSLEAYYTIIAAESGLKLNRDFTSDIEGSKKAFVRFYKQFSHLLDEVQLTNDDKFTLFQNMRDRFYKNYHRYDEPQLTFANWVKNVIEEVEFNETTNNNNTL